MAGLTISPISGALGAEISGVDLTGPLDAETVAAIRQAWLDHLVIFFHDQAFTPESYMAFAQAMGIPVEYPMIKGIDGFPCITEIAKLEHERSNFGGVWHADTTYMECPPMGTMLHALEIPPFGGDTLFANQYLAYEALSETMKGLLDGLVGVSTSTKADVSRTREEMLANAGDAARMRELVAEHPVVRTHPETGRKALYVNTAHTARFKGMSEEESRPILDFLFQHQVRPEFTCRFRWRRHSLAFWDNRAAQHNPVNDYHGYRRVMRRITLAGDRPF